MNDRIVVVMPAYNAEKTLPRTFRDIPEGSVDEIILVDDCSRDNTVEIARSLGIRVFEHTENRGYGANQKTCYREALRCGADIVVMIHPDYQYDPRLIPFATGFISEGVCDLIVGSRIRTRKETLEGGMPVYKYLSNRILTTMENVVLGQNLGDFHSGFRAYRKEVLQAIAFSSNSDDFVFDTELLVQAVFHGYRIGDIPVPTRYSPEASSVSFKRGLKYGIQTLLVLAKYVMERTRLIHFNLFEARPDHGSEQEPNVRPQAE